MRMAVRVIAGIGSAAMFAVAAPVASAQAAELTGAPTTWGPYASSDGKAKASGTVTVAKKEKKVRYWKRWWTWERKCSWHEGDRVCKKVKVWHKKRAFKTVRYEVFTVDSTLVNYRVHARKFRCAWETFKVVKKDGDTDFRSAKACGGSAKLSFTVVNADKIWVDVSRGNFHAPKGKHSGWKAVHPAV
ncbi:hypothetical protein Aph01nite_20860 [Acrocarpospora phusangensis]|uniref:Uncharacterized protein n=1 Tax=Acrocarpospora phusangensis TaxID=1070424 RepID=A0A919UJF3_9ACTN|nr:hypothetical protein [Acrocarpospora phusangensis]GIH23776.1 hypothetical protein Aph01nite_20860 [Acrocarpospora phusangensis]